MAPALERDVYVNFTFNYVHYVCTCTVFVELHGVSI